MKGPSRPVNPEAQRASLLAGLECVGLVVVFDQDTPGELIASLRPDVLVKGGDYDAETIVGADFVRASGGQVVVLPLVAGLSTTGILNRSKGETVSDASQKRSDAP